MSELFELWGIVMSIELLVVFRQLRKEKDVHCQETGFENIFSFSFDLAL